MKIVAFSYISGILFLKKITIGSFCTILDTYFRNISRVRSLVINDMRLETNGFTPDASFVHRWALCNNFPANV